MHPLHADTRVYKLLNPYDTSAIILTSHNDAEHVDIRSSSCVLPNETLSSANTDTDTDHIVRTTIAGPILSVWRRKEDSVAGVPYAN